MASGFHQRSQTNLAKFSSSLDATELTVPHLRVGDTKPDPVRARIAAAAGPIIAESCRAIHTCAPHVSAAWQRMLRTDISGDAFAFPPSHLQHPEGQGGEHLMPFPDLAVRNKEGLEDVTGAHTDWNDMHLGMLTYMKPAPRPPPPVVRRSSRTSSHDTMPSTPLPSESSEAFQAELNETQSELQLQLHLRGGSGSGTDDVERQKKARIRRAENRRRELAGIPRLPRGLWDILTPDLATAQALNPQVDMDDNEADDGTGDGPGAIGARADADVDHDADADAHMHARSPSVLSAVDTPSSTNSNPRVSAAGGSGAGGSAAGSSSSTGMQVSFYDMDNGQWHRGVQIGPADPNGVMLVIGPGGREHAVDARLIRDASYAPIRHCS